MDFADEWSNKKTEDRISELERFIRDPNAVSNPDYLRIVDAPDGWGVFASNGPNFKYAIFGRDSIVLADDLLPTHKQLVHDIILELAKLQGFNLNNDSEEEPGKIHHEFRSLKYDGVQIPEYSLGILRNLQRQWGNEGSDMMIYYGGYDATPLYVRLVCRYVNIHGVSILEETYKGRDNDTHKIRDSLRFAMGWISYKLNESSLGLIEYKRINPHGIENQAWKDSRTGYLHRDGSLPNFNMGVASIEIQGYTYDALLDSAKLIAENDEQAQYWRAMAAGISERVTNWFWMEDVGYFAQALDFNDNDEHRQIDSLTSNGALILNSQLIKNLAPEKRDMFVNKITEMISSKEFMTDAGIRSRALRHESIPGFIDYHGTYTVWHKETNEIAKGLRNHGRIELAENLESKLIDSVVKAGEFSEFTYVDSDNKVWYDKAEALHYFSLRSPGGNLPIPEPGQAWTISAVYRICLSGS